MPAAVITPPGATTPVVYAPTEVPHRRKCRVFVSYAHQDAKPEPVEQRERGLLGRFETELTALRGALQSEGLVLHADEVFIDTERLRTESYWRDAIEQARDECELMVFLVSVDALSSNFCIPHELEPAQARGADIVPVLLRPTAHWKARQINGIPLGEFHAGGLPKLAHGNAQAITDWSNRDEAWQSMSRDLRHMIVRKLFGGTTGAMGGFAPADPSLPSAPAPLLPYLCNQLQIVESFDSALDAWQRHAVQRPALAVVVQGCYADGLMHFSARLRHFELLPRLRHLGHTESPKPRSMIWPGAHSEPERFAGLAAARALFKALGGGLDGHLAECDGLADAAQRLDAFLQRRPDPLQVVTQLDRGDASRRHLKALLGLLDLCQSAGHELSRLHLFLLDETEEGLPTGAAAFDWRTHVGTHWQRTHFVALPPLQLIHAAEARKWYEAHAVDAHLSWPDCLEFFPDATPAAPTTWRQRLLSWPQSGAAAKPDQSAAHGPPRAPLRMRAFADAFSTRLTLPGAPALSATP